MIAKAARIGLLLIISATAFGAVSAQSLSTLESYSEDLKRWYRSEIDPTRQTELLVFLPLMPVDTSLSSHDDVAAQRAMLLLTDSVPKPDRIFTPSGHNTYDIYKKILDNRMAEEWQLTRADRRRLAHARKVLLARHCWPLRFFRWLFRKPAPLEHSRRYATYLEFAERYAALEERLLRETDAARRALLESEKQLLFEQWEESGHKKKVEAALTNLREVMAKDPEKFWTEAIRNWNRGVRMVNGYPLPLTRLDPPVDVWMQMQGWNTWASGNSSSSLKVVEIKRKWLTDQVLTTHPWKWGTAIAGSQPVVISDGSGLNTRNAQALMPLLPVKLLLAKDIVANGQSILNGEIVIAGVICKVLPKLPSN